MTSPVQHSECTRTKGNAAGCFFEQSIKCGWEDTPLSKACTSKSPASVGSLADTNGFMVQR